MHCKCEIYSCRAAIRLLQICGERKRGRQIHSIFKLELTQKNVIIYPRVA